MPYKHENNGLPLADLKVVKSPSLFFCFPSDGAQSK